MRSTHIPVRLPQGNLLAHTMTSPGGISQETAIADQAEVPEESLAVRYNETVDLVGIL